MRIRRIAIYALGAFAAAAPAPLVMGQQAKIDHSPVIGVLPHFIEATGHSVLDSGHIAAEGRPYFFETDYNVPLLWSPATDLSGGNMKDISRNTFYNGDNGIAYDLAADGHTVVGATSIAIVPHAFIRTEGPGGFRLLDPTANDDIRSEAKGISADGSTVVGYTRRWAGQFRAFRWTQETGMVDLGSIASAEGGGSYAYDVSADGSVIVGDTDTMPHYIHHAFRWTDAGMVDLGTIGGFRGASHAYGVSSDGAYIVGTSVSPNSPKRGVRAFVYTEADGMVELPNIGDFAGDSIAYSVSDDGRTIAGRSASEKAPSGEACVWIDGVAYSLRDLLIESYGVPMDFWTHLDRASCSPDGLKFTGSGTYVDPVTNLGPLEVAYRVTISPDGEPVVFDSEIEEGETIVVRVGETFRTSFSATDPDGGPVRMTFRSFMPSMKLTPPAGTLGTPTLEAELEFSPPAGLAGATAPMEFGFIDEGGYVRRTFSIHVPNDPPSVESLDPVFVELTPGQHVVSLSALVDDAEGLTMAAKWKVAGEIEETQSNIAPGTAISFEYDYPAGEHAVELEVTDSRGAVTTVHTTVTVHDTTDPLILVTQDVVAPTDAGAAFATNVALPEPTVSDSSGGEVTLTNDAPDAYPVGETIVTWTVRDEAGNEATATQKVTVEDREAPVLGETPAVRTYCDPGKLFSTLELTPPAVSDNVTGEPTVSSDAKPRFPIGTTIVVWTARDAAGNETTRAQTVRVLNRSPQANAGRNVTVKTTTDQGVRISLDGSASSDPDQHRLRFSWSADGVKLNGAKSATPSGLFPLGETIVALTVTDAGGKTDTDTVRVTVRLKPAPPPSHGRAADESFALAAEHAARGASRSDPASGKALSGAFYARAAATVGRTFEDGLSVGENDRESESYFRLAELRLLQEQYGIAAADALLSAYAETGDESLLTAGVHAVRGAASAARDFTYP